MPSKSLTAMHENCRAKLQEKSKVIDKKESNKNLSEIKNTTYFAEGTTQKAEKYLSEERKLGSTCFLAYSPARFV